MMRDMMRAVRVCGWREALARAVAWAIGRGNVRRRPGAGLGAALVQAGRIR
jgi:hypothetical protein